MFGDLWRMVSIQCYVFNTIQHGPVNRSHESPEHLLTSGNRIGRFSYYQIKNIYLHDVEERHISCKW